MTVAKWVVEVMVSDVEHLADHYYVHDGCKGLNDLEGFDQQRSRGSYEVKLTKRLVLRGSMGDGPVRIRPIRLSHRWR